MALVRARPTRAAVVELERAPRRRADDVNVDARQHGAEAGADPPSPRSPRAGSRRASMGRRSSVDRRPSRGERTGTAERARRPRPRAAERGPVGLPARAAAVRRARRAPRHRPSPRCARASRKVKDAGVLRQLSAIFDTRALGYTSALVAAKVDPDHIDEAAAIISEHPGVSATTTSATTTYNLWYTVAVPPGESLDEHIDVLHRESGALRHAQAADAEALQDRREARHDRQDRGQREGRGARARAAGAQGRDAGARPLRPRARGDPRRAGRPRRTSSVRSRRTARRSASASTKHDVLDDAALVQGPQADAPLRRGDEPPQRRLQGQRDGRVGRARRRARRDRSADGRLRRRVSHCYRRPTYDDWPYSVFTMVHGRSARDCEATIDAIRDETGVDEYCLLWSIKEYKKVRLATSRPSGTRGAKHTWLARSRRVVRRQRRRRRLRQPPRAPRPRPTTNARRAPTSHGSTLARRRGRSRAGSLPRSSDAAPSPRRCSRSFATTHGYTRYGNDRRRRVAEPARPHHRRGTRSASSSGTPGSAGAGSNAPRLSDASHPSAATL